VTVRVLRCRVVAGGVQLGYHITTDRGVRFCRDFAITRWNVCRCRRRHGLVFIGSRRAFTTCRCCGRVEMSGEARFCGCSGPRRRHHSDEWRDRLSSTMSLARTVRRSDYIWPCVCGRGFPARKPSLRPPPLRRSGEVLFLLRFLSDEVILLPSGWVVTRSVTPARDRL
jgi:hypothetical protein